MTKPAPLPTWLKLVKAELDEARRLPNGPSDRAVIRAIEIVVERLARMEEDRNA